MLLVFGLILGAGFATYATSRVAAHDTHAPVAALPSAPKVTVAPAEEKLVTEYEELTGRVDAAETVELRAL